MPVVRCETCKGSGMIIKETRHCEQLHDCNYKTITDLKVQKTCYDCGGSGCKWQEEKETE